MTCITSVHKTLYSAHTSTQRETHKASPSINRHGTLFQSYRCDNNANAVLKTAIYRSSGTLNILTSTRNYLGSVVSQDKAFPLTKNTRQHNSQPPAETSPATVRFTANTAASIEFAKTLLNTDETPPPINWSTHPLRKTSKYHPCLRSLTTINDAGTAKQERRISPQAGDLNQCQRLYSDAQLSTTSSGAIRQQARANIQGNIAKVSNTVKRLEENGKRLKAMQHLAEGAKARLQTLAENNQATRTDFDQRIKSRVDNKPSSLLTDSTKATGDIKAPLPVENASMSSVFSAAPISVKRKGARVVVPESVKISV